MIAILPMYDLPEVQAATDAWWGGLVRAFRQAGLRDVPNALTRDPDLGEGWCSPALLFGQTCGYPLTLGLSSRVRLIATPCYAAPGCQGPEYRSLVVVRSADPARTTTDLRGRPVAVNDEASFSGWHALLALVAREVGPGRFLGKVVNTGSHRASLAAVRAGQADVAAIDCVSHALLARHAPPEVEGTRVLVATPSAPGLPWITAAAASDDTVARLRAGLFAALADRGLADVRAALLIAGAEALPLAAYDRIVALAKEGRGVA